MAKPATKGKKNSAFMKPMQPSEHLAKVVGTEFREVRSRKRSGPHQEAHTAESENKREILAADKLQPIFGRKKMDMFQMAEAVNKHLR
jgi:upstream activation factor subunit UAF30